MSVSTKILLFAAVTITVICVLSGSVSYGARTGRRIRERVVASQEQLESLGRLDDAVWPFLNALSRAREKGHDTALVLREQQAQVLAERERFEATLAQEEAEEVGESFAREQERKEVTHALETLLHWMESTEKRLRSEPERRPIAPAVEWQLYQDYEERVGQYIDSLRRAEQEELTQRRHRWNSSVARIQLGGTMVTVLCIVITVAMTLSILLPLRGSLRQLRITAERIGRGDFEVALPAMGKDELGLLARAMDRMAAELRGTLQEKQRLIKAEAEASEREAHRYSAVLEDTVRARTAELEAANARLEESLKQLRTTQEQLRFSDRLATMGKLAAGVGHEINNPLSYILSNLRFIRKELEQDEEALTPERQEVLEAAAAAHEGAERVRLIVQQFRMMSRRDDVALGTVELGSVVQGAVKLASRELRDRARLVEDCDGVPGVWGNGPQLGQVVINLLRNAAQAIEPGKPEENEVRVVARESGAGGVLLEVRDTGCGIPQENLERIFEPFFTTKPVGEGTGLGLSVCHNIVTAMGGTIEVESEQGHGTTFRITLPLATGREGGGPDGKQVA
ncbi:sensor histidine kinase [Hyalangium sp.]|uniref:sensor histidine kinase n=1 Tax=Hyalangium sp. TaxID=2028555 RepID=UPI002D4432BF|nr:ATP-binding protein [Hyalangium sp.]HYH96497.1 ATP-binding protein [Hyalangium sp.]